MPEKGETEKLRKVGSVMTATDLEAEMRLHRVQAKVLFEATGESGHSWTVAWIDQVGLAVISRQAPTAYVVEAREIIAAAVGAGLDNDAGKIIVLPVNGEVRRGS